VADASSPIRHGVRYDRQCDGRGTRKRSQIRDVDEAELACRLLQAKEHFRLGNDLAPCHRLGVRKRTGFHGPQSVACTKPFGTTDGRITAAGVNPVEISVRVGERVTFINEDVQSHDVAGGPDIAHPDCREIDAVGFLVTGQSRQTAPLPDARVCDSHDHSNHAPIFNGRIIIR
jgi:hypothetical protein